MPNLSGALPRTAGVSIIIKLDGLAAGADDSIVKPFDTAELLARVRSALRRSNELRASPRSPACPATSASSRSCSGASPSTTRSPCCTRTSTTSRPTTTTTGSPEATKVLQATAELIREVATEVCGQTTFIGHGGGDFVIVSALQDTKRIAER